jgi:hypothetical protein
VACDEIRILSLLLAPFARRAQNDEVQLVTVRKAQRATDGLPSAVTALIWSLRSCMKPRQYSNAYVVTQDAAYKICDEGADDVLPRTGMLSVGTVVWLEGAGKAHSHSDPNLTAYAEDIGTICLSREVLAAAK